MAGRPDFTTPGTGGSTQTVAINSRPELHQVVHEQTNEVSAGNSQTTDVYAPTGSIYRVRGLFLKADAVSGTATGDHEWFVQTSPTAAGPVRVLRGSSSADQIIRYDYGGWRDATQTQLPSSEQAQESIIQRMEATENVPIRLIYVNNSDEATTAERTIVLYVEEVSY